MFSISAIGLLLFATAYITQDPPVFLDANSTLSAPYPTKDAVAELLAELKKGGTPVQAFIGVLQNVNSSELVQHVSEMFSIFENGGSETSFVLSIPLIKIAYERSESLVPYLPRMIAMLGSDNRMKRQAILWILTWLRQKATSALPELVKLLNHDDLSFRKDVAEAVLAIGTESPDSNAALDVLLDEFRISDKNTQCILATKLGFIGKNAKRAIPEIIDVFRTGDTEVNLRIVHSLELFQENAVPKLIEVLDDPAIRWWSIRTLGEIGEKAKDAIPILVSLISDDQLSICECSVWAVARIAKKDIDISPQLIKHILSGRTESLRLQAVIALRETKVSQTTALTTLSKVIETDPSEIVRKTALKSIVESVKSLQKGMREIATVNLQEIVPLLSGIQASLESNDIENADVFEITCDALSAELRSREGRDNSFFQMLFNKVKDNPWNWVMLCPIALWISAVIVAYSIYLVRPEALLPVHDWILVSKHMSGGKSVEMSIDGSAKSTLTYLAIANAAKWILLLSFLASRPRVLDAWVRKYVNVSRSRFEDLETVNERKVHVNVPYINGEMLTNGDGDSIRPLFQRKERFCLLIKGDGGSGKTSLACQIGRWASNPSKTLAHHLMIAVLIEEDFAEANLLDIVMGKLQSMVGEANPISQSLFENLLRTNRVLVIIDHLSEMNEASRSAVNPESPGFPIGALVVTSRFDEPKLGHRNTLLTVNLEGGRVASFVDAYLSQIGKQDKLKEDADYFKCCAELTRMVGRRQVTLLLAKLYIDFFLRNAEGLKQEEMPTSIPGLMLAYLDELHRNSDSDRKRQVKQDAMAIAWLCVKEHYSSSSVSKESALDKVNNEPSRFAYMESKLRILRTEGRMHDQVRFTIDVVAEYLAALWITELNGCEKQKWNAFFQRIDKRSIETTKSFLFALQDCANEKAKKCEYLCDALQQRIESHSVTVNGVASENHHD
jgi:HEAT repeats